MSYKSLDSFLEATASVDVNGDTDLYNAFVDAHNQYTPNDGNYTVPAGAKKTLLLGTRTAPGQKITHAVLSLTSTEGDTESNASAASPGDPLEIPLTPAEGSGPTAPAPSTSPTVAEATTSTSEAPEPTEEETSPAAEEAPDEETSTEPTPQQTYDNPSPDEDLGTEMPPPGPDYEGDPATTNGGSSSGMTREQCEAADPDTAPSSVRQRCYMDFGIRIGG